MDTEFEKEKRKLSSSSASRKRSRLAFKEALEMDFSGSVYHPKFMNFDLSLGVAPQQAKEKSESGSGGNKFRNSYLSRYRFTSNFLREKPYNFTLFMNKRREVGNRNFFERQTIDGSAYGGRLSLGNAFLPSGLSFSRSDEEINRSFRPRQESKEENLSVYLDPEIESLGKTRLDYTRNKFLRREAGTSDQKGTSQNLAFSSRRYFGDSRDKSLNSYLRYYSLTGSRDSKDITLNESLTIKHNDSLDTFYGYNFSDRSAGSIDTSRHKLRAGLRHKLYESLNTSFSLRGSYLESTSFDQRVAGASINEDYRKKIGIAVLRLGAGCSYEHQKHKSRSTFRYVTDETHTLTDGTVVYLNEVRIDISTVVITNSAGTVVYIEDSDYQVIEHSGDRVEIRRIAGGSISNGEEVLVDYIIRRNPSFSFAALQNNLRFSLGFYDEKLNFYYRLRQQRYPGIEGERNLTLEKVNDEIFGAALRLGGLNLNAEYEDYETDLTPYRALRLREGVTWSVSPRANFTLRSIQDYIDFSDEKRKNYEVRGNYSLRFSPSAVCSAESGYRWQRGDGINLKNFTSRIIYRIYIGAFFFETGYEYEKERSLNDYLESHYLYTKLKRDF